tara:strand:+ start:1262 stop:1489 length:228 start_codon:yes stop_codon:yes gene_type:complete
MGIFDKLKYGNAFGRTVSIKDTVVKQYPKEIKQEIKQEINQEEKTIVETPAIEDLPKSKIIKKTNTKDIDNGEKS